MLPKKKRLTTAEFNRFFASGTRRHTPYLQVVYHPHSTFHGAAVVGKKVSTSAVTRNFIRRRLYQTIYHMHQKDSLSGVYIVIAKPAVNKQNLKEVLKELRQALKEFAT